MTRSIRNWLWILVFVVLITFSVPWFLWGSTSVVAGLPLWLWWHIGWLGLTAVVFWLFGRTGWDRLMGVAPDAASERGEAP